MLKTHVQQGQVSGSLSFNDNVSRENLIKVNRTLADDLNSLRTQVKGILGSQAWTDEQAITLQNLKAQLTGTLNANNVDAAGTLSVTGAATMSSTLGVSGLATMSNGVTVNGAVADFNAGVTANEIKIDGDTVQRLYIVGASGELKDEANMIFDGSALKITGAISGSGALSAGGALTVAGAAALNSGLTVQGAMSGSGALQAGGALTVAGASALNSTLAVAGLATMNNGLTVNTAVADFNAGVTANSIKIDSDVAQRLYIVDSDGSIKDEANMIFDGSALKVTGAMSGSGALSAGGALTVAGASALNGALDVAGVTHLNNNTYVSGTFYVSGAMDVSGSALFRNGLEIAGDSLEITGSFGVSGSAAFDGSVKLMGDVAQRLYIVGDDGAVKDEANLSFNGSKLFVTGALDVSGNANIGGSLTIAGVTVNTAAADFNAGVTANEIKIDGDVAQRLYIVGASGELKDEANMIFDGSALKVTGAMSGSGALSAGGALTVAGASALNSTLAVSGLATLNNGLTVNSAVADFNAGVTANSIKIDGDTAQRLYIVDSDGSLKDESKLVFDGSLLSVTGAISGSGALSAGGALTVAGASDLNGALDVAGQVDLAAVGVATNVRGLLNVAGVADFNGGVTADEIKIDGDQAQRLYIVGASGELKDEAKLVFDGSELAVDADLAVTGDAIIAGNVQVDGDLRVKGTMTYIDTANMRVQDAFIYLATGSVGTTDSGIVLHGGAGAGMDLAIAQKGGAGEFIFGKGDRHPDGEGSVAGMELVPSKMSALKLGSAENALSGSLEIVGNDVKLAASAASLVFSDSYKSASTFSADFKLAASAAEWSAFQTQYPGKSLLGALGAGGGVGVNFRKKVVKGNDAAFSGNVLDISAAGVGSLRSTGTADADYGLDVYLNGVLLALGASNDYQVSDETHISFNYSLNVDDVLTIVAKNVA